MDQVSDVDRVNARVRDRNSWFKNILASAVLVAFLWKLVELDLTVEAFDFSDLLSLLVSLFAVSLSIAFYLKATETSNTFYDNTYRFTKDVSEILGRIEAGFGERLRHLDEGYAGIQERMATMPFDTAENKRAIEEEKKKLEALESQRSVLLSRLMNKAKLQEREQQEFNQKLASKEEELSGVRSELALLKRKRLHAANVRQEPLHDKKVLDPGSPTTRLAWWLIQGGGATLFRRDPAHLTLTGIRQQFSEISDALPRGAGEDLDNAGFRDEEGRLTSLGARWFRRWLLRRDIPPPDYADGADE